MMSNLVMDGLLKILNLTFDRTEAEESRARYCFFNAVMEIKLLHFSKSWKFMIHKRGPWCTHTPLWGGFGHYRAKHRNFWQVLIMVSQVISYEGSWQLIIRKDRIVVNINLLLLAVASSFDMAATPFNSGKSIFAGCITIGAKQSFVFSW